MPYKSSEEFAKMADEDGVVVSVNNTTLKVRYKSGEEKVYSIADHFSLVEGVDYKHVLTSNVKEGQRFKKGDALYYHKDFYEKDYLDPTKLVFKSNKVITVAMTVNAETYEDSSAISSRMMDGITTTIAYAERFIIPFDTDITNLVKVGDEVEPNTPLFVNLGDVGNTGNLSDASIALLEAQTQNSPRAQHKGVIERIEVKYNGDKADMSESLGKLVSKLDRETYERTKGTEYETKNNRVTGEYSSKGVKLDIDTLELKIYIGVNLGLGIGDKLVVGNQAKTVIGEIFDYSITGKDSGDTVDMMFGYLGFLYRIIDSPVRMGTTNRVVRLRMRQLAREYLSEK